ncbi:helix-turn-helix transcriptional regulator [Actinocorallia longicatena]|uniref:Helix-turn-helix transcriptional regulator n=1 Tax=Actinocorallia longicatena TaxID=111803 RepID=A0ABP6Q3Z2_9ACTN
MAAPRTQTVRQRRLGVELRKLRENSGMTGEEVAARFSWSTAKVSRIETAKTSAALPDVSALLALYEVDGHRNNELMALARDARERGWWMDVVSLDPEYATFIAMEDEADTQYIWDNSIIPGLLQTRGYATAVIQLANAIATVTPGALGRALDVRLQRQNVLTRTSPQKVHCVIDESVLHRPYGGPVTLREQLEHLMELSLRENVDLRVIPLEFSFPVVAEPFILLEFAQVHDTRFPDIVHTEGLTAHQSEKEVETYRYRLAHRRLSEVALTPGDSRDLLERLVQKV